MMGWLDKNEGVILKIITVIFVGWGTGLILSGEYLQAVEKMNEKKCTFRPGKVLGCLSSGAEANELPFTDRSDIPSWAEETVGAEMAASWHRNRKFPVPACWCS